MKGPETAKSHYRRMSTDFYSKYMQGKGLDIGYRGDVKDAEPVLPNAVGIDKDYPGYNGKNLPFPDESQDYVYSSHCLEHIEDYKQAIQEWFRVLKTGGYLVLILPHCYLYEKKLTTPSRFNGDHKRMYTPGSLLKEVEESLMPNSYRVRFLQDCDFGFDYSVPSEIHSVGEYQIELVLQKINKPNWNLE